MYGGCLNRNFDGAVRSPPSTEEPRMHPALIKMMAAERTAALYAAAAKNRRDHVEAAPRPGRIARVARRALYPAHA
jgi:hypothetical protein